MKSNKPGGLLICFRLATAVVSLWFAGCGGPDPDEAALEVIVERPDSGQTNVGGVPQAGAVQAQSPEFSRDPALVGTWINEAWSQDGSLMDVSVMTFHADGRASLGAARGFWNTANGIIYTREEQYPQLVPMMRYHIERGRMIVYYRDGTTDYWAKQQ